MSRQDDLDVNVAIRRILVRHWVDLGKITIRTTNSVPTLGGVLTRISDDYKHMITPNLDEIVAEIRRIRGVRHVNVQLTDWSLQAGGWTRAKVGPVAEPPVVTVELDDVTK